MLLYTLGIVFMMGPKCSTLQIDGKVHISGNGNSAVITNGVSYNISRLFNTAVSLIMQKYRSELILIQFTAVCLGIISALLVVRFLMPRNVIDKGKTI